MPHDTTDGSPEGLPARGLSHGTLCRPVPGYAVDEAEKEQGYDMVMPEQSPGPQPVRRLERVDRAHFPGWSGAPIKRGPLKTGWAV